MITDPHTGDTYRVIDVHQHLGQREGSDPGEPTGARLAVMDQFGIDQAVLLPASGAFGRKRDTMHDINARTAAAVNADPDRFLCGVAHLDLASDLSECCSALDHAVHELGLRGAVWHHRFQGVWLDHPHMPELIRLCGRLGVPALIHVISESNLESVWRLERLLRSAPGVAVCAMDAFSNTDQAEQVTDVAARHSHLYCDLGGMTSVAAPSIHRFLDQVGPDRLLFGTNLYMRPRTWHAPAALFEVLHMDASPTDKSKILAGNAASLLRQDLPWAKAGIADT